MDDADTIAEAAFQKAIALPAGERAAAIEAACGGDTVLVQRVNERLRAAGETVVIPQRAPEQSPAPGPPPPAARHGGSIHEGQRLGEFEILERLGQGGMGAVYKARQPSLNRFVALKTLLAALAGSPDYIARFHREAEAAAKLSHQNLVQAYSAGENDGMHWFAMEFVEGETAQGRLKRKGRLELEEALAILMHIVNGLTYAHHRSGLVHRDIKPDNIFLSEAGDVKLGDLGLAKRLEDTQSLTTTGDSMGTPHYISPEQARGRRDVDFRADIYSLGCTLFHLLSGRTPYAGESAAVVMMQHMSEPPPDIRAVFPECPAVVAEVILRMMQKEPAARQQSYEELSADLRRAYDALHGAPAPVAVARRPVVVKAGAAAVGENRKAQNPKHKKRVPLYSAFAAAALLAIGGVLWAAFGKKEPALSEAEKVERAAPSRVSSASGDGSARGATRSTPAATKDAPFVNTLGMKFVPVKGTNVLFCVWETRVRDYTVYAKSGNVDAAWSAANKDGVPSSREPEHPVASVSWNDANGFCEWLTKKEQAEGRLPKGMKYRLPTDEEWSRAVGLQFESGATPAARSQKNSVDFPWGTGFPPPKAKVGNYADTAYHEKFPNKKAGEDDDPDAAADPKAKNWIEGYTDGFATSAPVGSFPPNEYGIYDLGGNVWEWCEDWYDASQKDRVLRGASWYPGDRFILLSSHRGHLTPARRHRYYGFRCVVGVSAP